MHGHHKTNAMTLLHVTRTGNGRSSMTRFMLKTVFNPLTEGYRRVAAPEPDNYFTSTFSPDQHSVATQSSALRMSTQMLEAILRSSDASAFSTEDLTRLQAGICQQLADRTRQASRPHQPVRTSRGADPPESAGVAAPYLPASRPSSSDVKEKPIVEQ